jgi:DNA sulfur modification protein DndD
LDTVITEHWYEYVEEFIPARIASLFFFDGEKIEAFAEQHKTTELLRTGIHALLGLDLVNRLSTDLLTVERKRKTLIQSQQDRAKITVLEEEVKLLETQANDTAQQKIEAGLQLQQLTKEHNNFKEEYRREGGELFEQREQIEVQLKMAKQKRSHVEEQLRELAAGEAPLLLIRDLLRETEKQAIQEQEAKHNRTLHEKLEERDATLLQLLKQHGANNAALTAIQAFVEEDKNKRQQSLKTECYLNIEPTHFIRLQEAFLTQTQASANTLIVIAEKTTDEINSCERKLSGIPDPESLEGITVQLENTQLQINQAQFLIEAKEQEYQLVDKKLQHKQEELRQAYEAKTQEQFTDELTNRLLKHLEKVRSTLEKFSVAATKKHIEQLEALILDSFQQLIRKDDFITDIQIDPNSYTLTLYTPTHEVLSAESLSAGERQLLAISVLWGLSRASGRPLPAIIDTPLSRLDGKHRQNLVDNYFPKASHQVILLSTDEEINKKYYRHLKPAIGREYHILFDADKQSSVINPGYFF